MVSKKCFQIRKKASTNIEKAHLGCTKLKMSTTYILSLIWYALFNMIQASDGQILLTLSLLGFLKTRGAIYPPPFKSHVWCSNTTNDTSLEKSYALLLESAKKNCKIQLYSKNVCKKKCPKNDKIYIFKYHFKYAKIFAKY